MDYYRDTPEWAVLFKNAVDWDTIIPVYYPSFPTPEGFTNKEEVISFYEELVASIGKWAGTSLRERAGELDRVGSGTLKNDAFIPSEPLAKTYREAKELGLFSLLPGPEYGGMGVPAVVAWLAMEQVCRACSSTSIQLGFFLAFEDMIERFCPKETRDRLIPKIMNGELSGSMCLTEPGAGSDVGAIKTRAVKQADGTYLLNGAKIFISNGGGGLGFVLARTPGAPEGLKGISLFLVEEWLGDRHNYRITKLEEKMGLHGSATCEVVYENTTAQLVGEENHGFQIMLHLMNEARIGVGIQGIGGIEGSLDRVSEYAQTRMQFGKPLVEHSLYKRNLTDWETERDAIRVLMIEALCSFDVYQKLDMKKRHTGDLTEPESALYKKALRKTRHLTPLVKFYGSEAYAEISKKAIQGFGGYGFIGEYQIERYHRDSFGALLYEGTSQIQSLMAMKDFLKFSFRRPTRFLQIIMANHPLGNLVTSSNEFERGFRNVHYEFNKNLALLLLRTVTGSEATDKNVGFELTKWLQSRPSLKMDEKKVNRLIVHAETFCQGLAYVETLRALKKHAVKDPAAQGALFERYRRLVVPRLAAIYSDWKQPR